MFVASAAAGTAGSSGTIRVLTGPATAGASGDILLRTGQVSSSGQAGTISMVVGMAAGGPGGHILVEAGDTSGAGRTGGQVSIKSGASDAGLGGSVLLTSGSDVKSEGFGSGGQSGDVPKYEFRAPQLVMQASGQVVDVSVSSATYKPKPLAAGLPCILP